ncbi:MAG: zinc ribbon domain-containing protein [Opitutales bacterium]
MADPQIQKLLILQNRDVALQEIEKELKRVPLERSKLEKQIEAEQGEIETAAQALKQKEVERSELDQQVKTKEAEIARFKNQQLEVKKNDEYRALTQQIEQSEADIGRLEESEITLMLEIDEAKEAYEAEKKTIEARIEDQRRRIAQLAEKEKNLKDSIEAARSALAQSREGIEETYIENYGRVKKLVKRPPYIVPIEDHKCGGCHLRVSNEVSRGAMDAGEPHFCDQCARMVYA